MDVSSNGSTFRVQVDGSAERPTVMLAHGLATDLTMWDDLVPHLVPHYRVVRYDARGHGGSAATPGEYSLQMLAADAVGIMDALGLDRVHYAGLSMGGMTGLALALDHGQRLASLAVCDARASAPEAYQSAWAERSRAAREGGIEVMVQPSITRWFTEAYQTNETAGVERMRERIRGTSVDGFCGCAAALQRLAFGDRLAEIDCATLYLVGSHDSGAPPDIMRAMHEATPGSRFAEIADAGHISVVEQPAAFAAAYLGFLADASAGAPSAARSGAA